MGFNINADQALGAMTAGGTAFALGYVHGRKGEMPEKWNIPLDLAVGVGAHLVSMFGLLPRSMAKYAENAGNGAFSYYLGSLGGQMGQKVRKDAGELTGTANKRTITAGGWDYRSFGAKPAWRPFQPQVAHAYPR